jgi:hypothetical protein
MARNDRFLGAALLALCFIATPSIASAQCAFEHPKRAKKLLVSLVQAYLGCGEPYCYGCVNTETEGGVPACEPTETFDQVGGSQPGGWRWNELEGMGQVQLKASATFPPNLLNPPSNSADVLIQLKILGVVTDGEAPASGDGSFGLIARMTLNDRLSGDGTLVDFPLNAEFTMANGKAKLKTSMDTVMNGLPQPGLPRCSNIEVVGIFVGDPNGSTFASAGVFLP